LRYTLFDCKACKYQVSVIAGTIFQDTRTPLTTWFTAIWWISTQKYGASAEGLQQVLGLGSYETAWTWLHKIRRAMVRPNRTKLSGMVEIDETYIGGEEHGASTGRGTGNKVLVVVAIEIKDAEKPNKKGLKPLGRVRLSVIKDASADSLLPFIENNIERGSNVITDGWSSYASLSQKDYAHTVYVQSKKQDADKTLPHVHLIISLLKRWLLGTHQGAASDKHMQAYLDEYTFRFNRRTSSKRGLLFYRLLECAVNCAPHTYDNIVKPSKSRDGHDF
jgi:transposase-like protein